MKTIKDDTFQESCFLREITVSHIPPNASCRNKKRGVKRVGCYTWCEIWKMRPNLAQSKYFCRKKVYVNFSEEIHCRKGAKSADYCLY